MINLSKSEQLILFKLYKLSENNILQGFNADLMQKIGEPCSRYTYMSTLKNKGAFEIIETKRNPKSGNIVPYKRKLCYIPDVNGTLKPISEKQKEIVANLEVDEKVKNAVYDTIKTNSKNGIFTATKNVLARLVGVFYPEQKVNEALEVLKSENKIAETTNENTDKFTWVVNEIQNEINQAFGEESLDTNGVEIATYSNENLSEEDEKLVGEIINSIRYKGQKYKLQNQTIDELRERNKELEVRVIFLEKQNQGLRNRIQQIQYEIMKSER